MGILNVTPDSFFDGNIFLQKKNALRHAGRMVKEGADIIDIGGESSGPGSENVSVEEELRRVIPVVKAVRKKFPELQISVDTYKAEVARRAIAAGATMINDVTALRGDAQMARVIAESGVPVVLMYSKDPTARTTRAKKRYKDVVKTIKDFLRARIAYAKFQGIRDSQIIIDPGMGVFVSGYPKYSFEILARLKEFQPLGYPILVGASRKGFLGGALKDRLGASVVAHITAVQNGANIIRVHDVAAHRDILDCVRLIHLACSA